MTDNQKQLIRPSFWIISLMIFVAAFIRLIPHPPNFAPIAATALFAGAYFNKKIYAFIVPIVAMILTDAIIGFHPLAWLVYLSFALIVFIGIFMLKIISVKNLFFAATLSSVSFFLITNFGVWLGSNFYPQNFYGLIQCYIAAIPFFHNNLLGDLFYSTILFGLYEIIKIKIPALKESKV
jgi:hypothetical protein